MGQLLSRLSRLWRMWSSKKSPTGLSNPGTREVLTPIENTGIRGVFNFFSALSPTEILEYCLGYEKPGAPDLAEDVVLIALRCHTLDEEPHPLLQIGVHFISRHEAKVELENPGPHSSNILCQIAYSHTIIKENAHHANRLPNPREAEINRFGATRFVSIDDQKDVLERIFGLPTMNDSPTASESDVPPLCPVVLLGYDVPQWHTLLDTFTFDRFMGQNVVAVVQTKKIACEPGYRWHSAAPTLSQLTQELEIEYPARQSASDQAAYALIDAIQLVMRPRIPLARESIQSVINHTILSSQSQIPWWGERDFCTMCGDSGHRRLRCRFRMVPIEECWKCFLAERHSVKYTHVPEMCPFFHVVTDRE